MAKSVGWGALAAFLVFVISILVGWVLFSVLSGHSPFSWWLFYSGGPCSIDPGLRDYYNPVCDSNSLISRTREVSFFVFGLGAPITSLVTGVIVTLRKEKNRKQTPATAVTA